MNKWREKFKSEKIKKICTKKEFLKENLKRDKAITLIALVITIIDACIDDLKLEEKVVIYKKEENEISVARSIIIRESMYKKLEEMRVKYGISISKLINIAIRSGLDKYDK